jgi:hypothetical protein
MALFLQLVPVPTIFEGCAIHETWAVIGIILPQTIMLLKVLQWTTLFTRHHNLELNQAADNLTILVSRQDCRKASD